MTTIVVTKNKMVSDGQVSYGDRIDAYDFKKIRKINGCLVGGAGRLSSVLAFFDWFEEYTSSSLLKSSAPEVNILIPEGIDDEDFTGVVLFSDGDVLLYEGGKRCYPAFSKDYYAIGSGASFAIAALDAGASAEQALEIAKKRDISTGGETFVEELSEEDHFELPTREQALEMSKEELVTLLFPSDEVEDNLKDIEHKEQDVQTTQQSTVWFSADKNEETKLFHQWKDEFIECYEKYNGHKPTRKNLIKEIENCEVDIIVKSKDTREDILLKIYKYENGIEND